MRALRSPELEWARSSASGALDGADWVDPNPPADAEPYSVVQQDGAQRFRHVPYAAFVPDLVAEAGTDPEAFGLLQALQLMFARSEWLVRTRDLLLSAHSPCPALLADVVEAAGVGPETHRHDAQALAHVRALLPSWLPRRGRLDAALEMHPVSTPIAHATTGATEGPAPDLGREVLAARDEGWWAARAGTAPRTELRITNGFLLFQPADGSAWRQLPEDVSAEWRPAEPLDAGLVRLLPPWTTPRLALAPETP